MSLKAKSKSSKCYYYFFFFSALVLSAALKEVVSYLTTPEICEKVKTFYWGSNFKGR